MYHPGKMYNRPNMWPQYWGLYEPRGLETKRPKKPEPRGPEKGTYGGLSPTPHKKNDSTGYHIAKGGTTEIFQL
jgi:hypothetical protein